MFCRQDNFIDRTIYPRRLPLIRKTKFCPLKVLKAVVEENSKQTAREFAKQFSTCHRTIITQLNKLGKVSKYGQWVPHNLTANQLAQKTLRRTELGLPD